MRKGLIVAWLLPFLTFDDKIHMLPATCCQIRHFIVAPSEKRHFYNCIYTNLLPFTAELTLNQNQILQKLLTVTDWGVARNLIHSNEFEQIICVVVLIEAGIDKWY